MSRVYLLGDIDEVTVGGAIAELLNAGPNPTLVICSHGGSVEPAKELVKVMRDVGADTETNSHAESVAAIVFLAGRKRVMGPDAVLMFHKPTYSIDGNFGSRVLRAMSDELGRQEEWALSEIRTGSSLGDHWVFSDYDFIVNRDRAEEFGMLGERRWQ